MYMYKQCARIVHLVNDSTAAALSLCLILDLDPESCLMMHHTFESGLSFWEHSAAGELLSLWSVEKRLHGHRRPLWPIIRSIQASLITTCRIV